MYSPPNNKPHEPPLRVSFILDVMPQTRNDTDVWLVGPRSSQIRGARLPSKRQVMSKLFYLLRWSDDPQYLFALEVVKNLRVVNDGAERGVALMSEFNLVCTKNENQKQCMLRGVYEHRQRFTSCLKSKLC